MGLMQWNFNIKPSGCCVYHALLEDLEDVLGSMKLLHCRAVPPPDCLEQCPFCGVLCPESLDEHGCEWCHTRPGQSGGRCSLGAIFEDALECGVGGDIIAL